MEPWTYWIIGAVVFIIIEIFTYGFAIACFAIGALAAAVCDLVGVDLVGQIIVFCVFTIIAFLTVRPLVLKHFYNSGESNRKSNVDALMGRQAKVSEEINPEKGTGRVALDGDDWKAVSENGVVIPKGSKVKVVARDSIVLTVESLQ